MPTYFTGSVRYHVSDFLCDRLPHNPQTSFETQREREAGKVQHSHTLVAYDQLLLDIADPNHGAEDLVKALRLLLMHAASAEVKVELLRRGLVPKLAAVLGECRGQVVSAVEAAEAEGGQEEALGWAAAEQQAAQLLRSLCVLPQGCFCVVEEGGWAALVACIADRREAVIREHARVSATAAIALLASNNASGTWLTTPPAEDGPSLPAAMALEGYHCADGCGDTKEQREDLLGQFFDAVVAALRKEHGSPRLLLGLLDATENLSRASTRCLHLALIAGLLRALVAFMSESLLQSDLWLHADASTAASGPLGVHSHPGSVPVGAGPVAEVDIAARIADIMWIIGLDDVGKQEVLELPTSVYYTGQLLQLILNETKPEARLSIKATLAGAIGALALLPEAKMMATSKKGLPIAVNERNPNAECNAAPVSILDLLLRLLRTANEQLSPLQRAAAEGAEKGTRLSVQDTKHRAELEKCVANTVQAIRLIAELPAARQYMHSAVFLTASPPADLDGPAMTIAATQDGKDHALRRQIFFSTKWEKDFKVYVY